MTKERKREANRRWVEKNREKVRAYHKAWVAANREKQRKYSRDYKARNPQKSTQTVEYARSYRAKNREKLRLKAIEYRRKNPEKWRKYNRDYQRTSYHLRKASTRVRRTANQRRWWAKVKDEKNRERRERRSTGFRDFNVTIPETTTRMEVEQEMILAKLEGRDPVEARRAWFAREKAWTVSTRLLRTPYEDGPYYQERRSA